MDDLVTRLFDSDVASALTNEAAREIERLKKENERLSDELAKLALVKEPWPV